MPQAVETTRFEQDCQNGLCRRTIIVDLADERAFPNDPEFLGMDGDVRWSIPPVGMGHVWFDCPVCGRTNDLPMHTLLTRQVRDLMQIAAERDAGIEAEEDLPEDDGPDPYADVHPWYRPDGPWGPPPAEL